MRRLYGWVACLASFIVACSDSSPPTDAGADAAGDGGALVASPEATLPPDLTPCPDGWREVAGPSGTATCDPWPTGGATDCPVGEAHFPGEPGCMTVGAACPSGAFAADLPAGTSYVDAAATPGGDGTASSPLSSIAEARATLPDGSGVIALARGAYDEDVRVESGELTLIGACAAETSLTRTSGEAPRAIASARGGQLTIRNLRIHGAEIGVASIVDSGSLLTLEGVQIDDVTSSAGVAWDGGSLVVRDSAVRDTENGSVVDQTGRAFQFLDGGSIALDRVVIERARDVAILGARADITLTDVAIREVRPRLSNELGRALEIFGGATASLTRVVVEDAYDSALLVGETGTRLTAEDLLVRRILPSDPAAAGGRCIEVIQGAHVEVTRGFLDECSSIAVFARRDTTTAAFTDLVISRTRPAPDGTFGRGFEASLGATTTMERVHFDANYDTAILLSEDAALDASDLTVTRTASEMVSGTRGTGLSAQYGADVTLTRARLDENRSHGIFLFGEGTSLTGSDVVVTETRGWENSGIGGVGAAAQNGSAMTLTRALFERNREVGVLAYHGGTMVTLMDVAIRDTLHRDCVASGGCEERSAGLAAVSGAHVTAERFLIADGALVGVQLGLGGEIDLRSGEVRGHVVGASVDTDAFDTSRLTVDVVYRDNDTNLDSRALPLPDVGDPLVGGE